MDIADVRHGASALAGSAVRSATTAARHPIGTTARVVGFAKGTVTEAVHLGRGLVTGTPPDADTHSPVTAEPQPAPAPPPVAVPDPADLPEPVVIEGEAPPAEEVHHEPKVAGRDAAHGRGAGDPEQRRGFVDEIPDDDAAESPVASEPTDDEPLIDPGAARAVRREAETLRKAADPRPE